MFLAALLGVITASTFAPPPALALDPPPAPSLIEPGYFVDFHQSSVFVVRRSSVCPDGVACVLGGGGGLGVLVERRLAEGIGLAAEYSAWFLDSTSVYELGAFQSLAALVRYFFLSDSVLHPMLFGGLGIVVYGDTFGIDTVGGDLRLGGGAELELTHRVAVSLTSTLHLFAVRPFTPATDGLRRADPFGVNALLEVALGVTVYLAD